MMDMSKACRNEIINGGAAAWPKSCPRCGLAKNCPAGVELRAPQPAEESAQEDTAEFVRTLEGAAKEATDEWIAGFVRQHFGQAAARTQPAGEAELPPLPAPFHKFYERPHGAQELLYYTADQMRQYGEQARAYQRKVDEKIIARRDAEIASLRSQLAQASKPIYQAQIEGGNWCDIEASAIKNWQDADVKLRTLYAAPPPAAQPKDRAQAALQEMVDIAQANDMGYGPAGAQPASEQKGKSE